MKKLFVKSVFAIICLSFVSYFIYIWILQVTQTDVLNSQILLAYIINTILAIGILSTLFYFRQKFKDQLGFIFMIGSFIKFGFFFIFFYPIYHLDGVITRSEFLSFFMPYVICLIAETVASIRLLNRLDANK